MHTQIRRNKGKVREAIDDTSIVFVSARGGGGGLIGRFGDSEGDLTIGGPGLMGKMGRRQPVDVIQITNALTEESGPRLPKYE